MPQDHPTLREIPRFFRPEPVDDRALVLDALGELTSGVLHEFRNHLTLLLSSTGTLRSRLAGMANGALDPEIIEIIVDMEESLHQVIGLTGSLDSLVSAGRNDVRQEVGEIVQRAVRLAGPTVKSNARVVVNGPSVPVKNRTGMTECALGMLLVELAEPKVVSVSEIPGDATDTYHSRTLRVVTRPESTAVFVELHSSTPGHPPGGRRVRLARELLARVGGSLEVIADAQNSRQFVILLKT